MRARYREDPMVSMPRWLMSFITDKMLPRGLKSMQKAAVDRQKAQEKALEKSTRRTKEKDIKAPGPRQIT